MIPTRLRSLLFWTHFAAGVLVCLAVVPMAITGAMLAFSREIEAWSDKATVAVPASELSRLAPSEIRARAARDLPADVKPDTLEIERDPAAPAVLETDAESWLVNPYDGHVLGVSRASRIFSAAAEVHFTIGLFFVGLDSVGSIIAGAVAIGMALLSLTGPWLWWPRMVTARQLRRRLWFSSSATPQIRDFNWHHVFGIWSMPMIVAASVTGILLRFEPVRDVAAAVLGKRPDPELTIDADTAVREAAARAPEWSAIRISWPEEGGLVTRVRFGCGVRPTQWAVLESLPPDASGARAVTLRRYEDGRAGDKLLGWARWVHTGQAFGRIGQAIWFASALGIVGLAWTGAALALRRMRRRPRRVATPRAEE